MPSSLVTNGKIRTGNNSDKYKKNFDEIDWGARARSKASEDVAAGSLSSDKVNDAEAAKKEIEQANKRAEQIKKERDEELLSQFDNPSPK